MTEKSQNNVSDNADPALAGLIEVEGPDEIPEFASDEEEMQFWDTHRLGDRFFDRAARVPNSELPPPDLTRLEEPAPRQA